MEYKGTELTFDNYSSVLSDVEISVRDEVRSAILDGTDIGDYIPLCLDDPYRLQQIRIVLKTKDDKRLTHLPDGDVIYAARMLSGKGVNLDSLFDVDTGAPSEYFAAVLHLLKEGTVIPENFDINTVRLDILNAVVFGLCDGQDVEDIVSADWVNSHYAKVIVRLRARGYDADKLVKSRYAAIDAIASIRSAKCYSWVTGIIEPETSSDVVEVLEELYKAKFPISKYDLSGKPAYQLEWVLQAWSEKLDVEPMLTEVLSNSDLALLYEEGLKSRGKRLSFRI